MSLIIDMLISCSKAPEVKDNEDGTFDVRIFEPSEHDLLLGFDVQEIVSHFGEENILKAIDEDNAAKFYGFVDRSTQYEM